ncbi:SOS response-associated peptidase [Nesterenkonia flava]|uniref:Abasic site processing protein n=1 Tax=Nesterenkonia flava TaxID=469799 RepID=A0ABU1FT32_9MICC|nr:SOS response-associated peptidase [Nesterenkonia flava]MDR5711382.1 SOS response-associated peptidase [Nesterenkonia flava]
MCGRYVTSRSGAELATLLRADLGDGYNERVSYNVAPTTDVPVLLERPGDTGTPHRELHTARWGLLPIWAKDKAQSARAFNARSETVIEKPTFRSAVRTKRCAVPADAYYEWWKDPEGNKRPYAVRRQDGQPHLFAGLYEWWRDKNAGDDEPWILSCTILTGPSPDHGHAGLLGELAGLHDRMPLPLSPETVEDWIKPGDLDKTDAETLVERVRGEALSVAADWEIYEVSRDVGNVRNNHPGLLEPV